MAYKCNCVILFWTIYTTSIATRHPREKKKAASVISVFLIVKLQIFYFIYFLFLRYFIFQHSNLSSIKCFQAGIKSRKTFFCFKVKSKKKCVVAFNSTAHTHRSAFIHSFSLFVRTPSVDDNGARFSLSLLLFDCCCSHIVWPGFSVAATVFV